MIDITKEMAGCQITEKIYTGSRTLVYKGIDLQNSASVVIKLIRKDAGLGLSMSYQTVVGKHNGHLWCGSTHSLGSKFVIEIPIKTTIKI